MKRLLYLLFVSVLMFGNGFAIYQLTFAIEAEYGFTYCCKEEPAPDGWCKSWGKNDYCCETDCELPKPFQDMYCDGQCYELNGYCYDYDYEIPVINNNCISGHWWNCFWMS